MEPERPMFVAISEHKRRTEGAFARKMADVQVGADVLVSFKDEEFGSLRAKVVASGEQTVTVLGEDGVERVLERAKYEFFAAPLEEVERALGSRSSVGKAEVLPPLRLRMTMRAVENLRRSGTPDGTLADPDKLSKLLLREYAVFGALREYDLKQAATIAIKKLKLEELGVGEGPDQGREALQAVRIVTKHGVEKDMAVALVAAIQRPEKVRDLVAQFPTIDADTLGAILVALVRAGLLSRDRLREATDVPAVAESIMLQMIQADAA